MNKLLTEEYMEFNRAVQQFLNDAHEMFFVHEDLNFERLELLYKKNLVEVFGVKRARELMGEKKCLRF
jgi:hypothetical protein